MTVERLEVPIVQAPMAGGVSTPELAAAVSEAGGLGFLAAGYLPAAAVGERLVKTRELTSKPFGLNIFVPDEATVDEPALTAYVARLRPEAEHYGVSLGEPAFSDDDWAAKLELVRTHRVPVVSFAFGCPAADVIAELRGHGTEVLVTVTSAEEATTAAEAGADALIVQGQEAGGHRSEEHTV